MRHYGSHQRKLLDGQGRRVADLGLPSRGRFIRPTAEQRTDIAAAFERHGLAINKSGFDVVSAEHADAIGSVEQLATRTTDWLSSPLPLEFLGGGALVVVLGELDYFVKGSVRC